MMIDVGLLIAVLGGIGLLLFLILYLKIQAFLALLIASICVGLFAGMPPTQIIEVVKIGMGNTLGFVATVVGLGALFGAILEQSGGATAIANFLLQKFGERNASWALMLTGFIVAIPVFFDVAFIILIPLVYSLQRSTGKSLLLYGIPLLAGLAITHSFIPPTPGPIAVADILGADLGWVILFGVMVGIPVAVVSGPMFGKYIAQKISVGIPSFYEETQPPAKLPSIGLILIIIATPILLIVLNTVFSGVWGTTLGLSSQMKITLSFLGHPFVALIIANLMAWGLLGLARGYSKSTLLEISSKSLAPAGVIILLTGAGGVLKQMLIETGAGEMLAQSLSNSMGSPLFFAFVVAAIVRVMQGSATVAMITSAGMTASLIENASSSSVQLALLVLAISAGATTFSHVNDSGFWLVNRYFGLTEKQTLASWSVMTTIIAVSAFSIILLLYVLV